MSRSGLPRVVIDGRMVGGAFEPVANAVRMIAKGLAELPRLEYEPVFLCAPGMREHFSGFEAVEQRTNYLDPKEIATLPIQLWKLRAKLYHSPSISSLASAPCPWIASLPDLRYLAYGTPFERVYLEALAKPFLARAARTVVYSESVAHEIVEWSSRIKPDVLSLPIDPAVLKAAELRESGRAVHGVHEKDRRLQPGRYFFSPAGSGPRENLRTLVEAFTRFRALKEENATYHLAIIGDGRTDEGGVPGVIPIGPSREEAYAALVGARAVFLPAVYEGFSQTAIETAAIGGRLVVSDIVGHRSELKRLPANEVRWVKPLSIDGWVSAFSESVEGGGFHAVSGTASRGLLETRTASGFGEGLNSIYSRVLSEREGVRG
jgi:glycosyltransferase involved in cell wall biosynthesis